MLKLIVIFVVSCVVLDAQKLRQSVPADVRIVGGEDADIANFPWQISLQYRQEHYCGGILLSKTWVATAAHCVTSGSSTDISIRAGSSIRDSGGQVIDLKKVIRHPKASNSSFDYDIALLKLVSPVTIANARTATLPKAEEAIPVGATLTVTGWGLTAEKNKQYSINLKQISVPTLSQADCQRAYPNLITSHMFCAGLYGTGGKDACTGDSGGPAVVNGKVIGMVSWGNGCAQSKFPGVYVKVSTFRAWIKEVTGI